jgi:hypothetical protein
VVGALLGPLSLLALLPLLLTTVRSTVHRAVFAATAVGVAGLVAAIRRSPLPLTGESAPPVPLAGLEGPAEAASRLLTAAPETLAVQALVLALAAAALPHLARANAWALAGFGAALMAALLLPDPSVAAAPAVAAVWLTCGVCALKRA